MPEIINFNDFADGAVAERLNIEVQKVLQNIADPNTDPKKERKVTLVIKFKADEGRDVTAVQVAADSKLVPAKSIESKILMDLDSKGRVTGAELKSGVKGQSFITEDGEIAEDTGKVISFK